jgi:hypothetical protein
LAALQLDLHNAPRNNLLKHSFYFILFFYTFLDISVNNIKLTIMRTTTAELLTTYLHHTRMLDAELDAVCTRERIMLAYEQPIPPDMENLVIVAKSKLLSKNVEFEDRSERVSALPQVDLALILKYVRYVSIYFSPRSAREDHHEKKRRN